jgi:hypothetical protein
MPNRGFNERPHSVGMSHETHREGFAHIERQYKDLADVVQLRLPAAAETVTVNARVFQDMQNLLADLSPGLKADAASYRQDLPDFPRPPSSGSRLTLHHRDRRKR